MATTNRERVGKALDLLRDGLAPYVQREVQAGAKRVSTETIRRYGEKPVKAWDAAAILRFMTETWRELFDVTLGRSGRNLASELREWRNKWAHQERFSSDDTDRALDSAERLLTAVSAPQAAEVARMKLELRRLVIDEQVRGETRRIASGQGDALSPAGIKAWREVVEPHEDVATGRYQQAEFAADLGQVHKGEGVDEYRDPVEFFRRTYVTEDLQRLLVGAIRRLSGGDGDPVVQLQTNFGGGKTHSMMALYHLFSGIDTQTVSGLEVVLEEAGVSRVDKVSRVVLVGTQISPGDPTPKDDGTTARTLWGEIAYQLGGREAYERVRVDDESATNPGDKLRDLLERYGPCAILIDEWVAYARQLHDEPGLAGGTFETQFTFAQTLTEAVKGTRDCLLVVSLPASDQGRSASADVDDSEVGGVRGRDALVRLRNVVARLESPWRPATAEEGFEIVRRRLFKPLADQHAFKQRDVTARAFVDLYQKQRAEFPAASANLDYERRIQAAYPIHPEVFDRLYTDWSSLARFQRTRGVLRLMATVIHHLWATGDRSPLIQPWNFQLDNSRVQNELTRYLSDNWVPVIAKDVDGDSSLPVAIDRDAPNLGKLAATRRVARTIYLGSAPITEAAQRGVDDTRIKLGCVVPGESAAVFGDSLRRLAAKATYLYQDGVRYWYDTQPTVAKLAEDRAEELRRDPDRVAEELEKRLRSDLREQGGFARVHTFPKSPADVADESDARLVVLPPEADYVRGPDNPAQLLAAQILETRGAGPRMFRNAMVFLAADRARLQELDDALRRFLAWQSIVDDVQALNLDPHQVKQASAQRDAASATVLTRVPETYQWLLVPEQPSPDAVVSWKALRLTASGPLAERAARRLLREELLVADLGPTVLRLHLDAIPLWRGDHVGVRQLIEDFGQYVYLPRLVRAEVLAGAVRAGVSLLTWERDAFAFADGFDEEAERYAGLRVMQDIGPVSDSRGVIVRSKVARKQLDLEAKPPPEPSVAPVEPYPDGEPGTSPDSAPEAPPLDLGPAPRRVARRFHATATLRHSRIGPDASRIAEEVVSHLDGIVGSEVTVTLEIEVSVPDGVPEQVERVVTENCATLKFDAHSFEES
ncbi:MAG: ATP-binding protein [Gammaproteobacteria bacterium]|nr:ATP-binding protein [Gammaproteobacteria bacterium]